MTMVKIEVEASRESKKVSQNWLEQASQESKVIWATVVEIAWKVIYPDSIHRHKDTHTFICVYMYPKLIVSYIFVLLFILC